MRRAVVLGAVIFGLLLAGCGASDETARQAARDANRGPAPPSAAPSAASLVQGVRNALRLNARLSTYVLWHNEVPSWARRSTRGPALRSLNSSAASRRSHGIRIRTETQHLAILNVRLDASYLLATARIRATGRVLPHEKGRRPGRPIHLDERAEIKLHRLGRSARFVVWSVTPAR